MIGINIILKLYRKFLLAFAYRNFLWNTISSINFIKKIKGMGFSMTVASYFRSHISYKEAVLVVQLDRIAMGAFFGDRLPFNVEWLTSDHQIIICPIMSSFLQFASNRLSVQVVSAFFMQTTKLWQHRLIRRVQFFKSSSNATL